MVNILVELQRQGVQIFIATHDYVLLREFDLATNQEQDNILYHSFYLNNGSVSHQSTEHYLEITPNAIDATFGDILVRDIQRKM